MSNLDLIFNNNRAWAEAHKAREPGYFREMAQGQSPEYLWIGCADSRVEASQITGLKPGELFVHRNVANIFYPNDKNISAVLQYSVEALKVKKIVVCGHYCCGGVKAALDGVALKHVDTWIDPIREVIGMHRAELEEIEGELQKWQRLVELNTLAQVAKVKAFPSVQSAEHSLSVHACVYSIEDGLLSEIHE